jgi:hypothetical protein
MAGKLPDLTTKIKENSAGSVGFCPSHRELAAGRRAEWVCRTKTYASIMY